MEINWIDCLKRAIKNVSPSEIRISDNWCILIKHNLNDRTINSLILICLFIEWYHKCLEIV